MAHLLALPVLSILLGGGMATLYTAAIASGTMWGLRA
jgi:hypothetical protein